MLDLFSIFTKGGIVLWYFQGTALSLTPAVNSLIKTVLLQVRLRVKNKEFRMLSVFIVRIELALHINIHYLYFQRGALCFLYFILNI